MGNGRNTVITAGQVGVAGFETMGEFVHGRGKKQTRKCEIRNRLTLRHTKP